MNVSIHILIYISFLIYITSFIAIVVNKTYLSFTLLIAGFICNTVYLIQRLNISGYPIPHGIFDSIFFTPWAIAFSIITLFYLYKNHTILYANVVLVITILIVIWYPKGIMVPEPHKSHVLAYTFFVTESFGIGLFYISGCYSLLCLLNNNNNNNDYFYFANLSIIYGFIMYSIAQFTGAAWCYYGWGTLFKWSPRHLQSAFIWTMYVNFIHLKYIPYFNNEKKSLYALLCSLFTFIFYLYSYIHEYTIQRIGG